MSLEAIILPKNEKNASNAEDCSAKKEEEFEGFFIKSRKPRVEYLFCKNNE